MTPSDYLKLLSAMKFSSSMWNPTRFLFDDLGHIIGTSTFDSIRFIGLALLGLTLALEITRRVIKSTSDGHLAFPIVPVIATGILGVIMSSSILYTFFVQLGIASGVQIQNTVINKMIAFLEADLAHLLKTIGGSSFNLLSIFGSAIELFTPIGLLSVVLTFVGMALLYMIPLAQAVYITLFFFLGPILLPFSVFQPTKRVALFWGRQMAASIIMGVVTSITYTIISATELLSKIGEATDNHTLGVFYSFLLIIMLIGSVSVSFKIFSTTAFEFQGGFKKLMAPVQAIS